MGKKTALQQKETQFTSGNAVGNSLEQYISVEDNTLPSPQDLSEYQKIDPRIVDYLLTSSAKEQNHRHEMEAGKLAIIQRSERRTGRMNWWGMFFAFLALLTFVALAAYALYLDKPWFAGIVGFTAVAGIITTFVNAGKRNEK